MVASVSSMTIESKEQNLWHIFKSGFAASFLLFCASFSHTVNGRDKTTVYLYTYHNKPPFIVDLPKRTGMFYDLARLLSSKSQSYRFITYYVPRKRLDRLLQSDRLDGVVIGAIPAWFKDVNETRYLWLPGFFEDADEFVSVKSHPFEYTTEDSLHGLTMAGVSGYYYFGVESSVSKGKLTRIDTIGEREVLTLIEKGRADMGIVSASVFKYFQKQGQIEQEFHFSKQKHEAFQRRAFTSLDNPQLHEHMLELFATMREDGSWERLVAQYQ